MASSRDAIKPYLSHQETFDRWNFDRDYKWKEDAISFNRFHLIPHRWVPIERRKIHARLKEQREFNPLTRVSDERA